MIGVAILGAGIGAQHLAGFRALPGQWDVRMVVDRDAARAQALGAPVETDIDAALTDPAVEVVDICLPPHLHVPVALKALAAGKHVICEKPIATSLADVDRLRVAQGAAQFFPVFQYRFGPGFAALRALRAAGLTGRPLVAALETHWARGPDYYAVPWRGTWEGEQGGAVLGHAIHAHDLLREHMGAVRAVMGAVTTRANPIETEDCAALSFELEGGALATSSITLGAAVDETRLRFVYDKLTTTSGTLPYAPADGPWRFEARAAADQAAIDDVLGGLPPVASGFAGAFAEIAKQLSGGASDAVLFEDGAASIELVTAIYDAARRGGRVSLPIHPDHPLYSGWRA
ncbi:Gfo/Idh/MocA family oxidoreductase [Aliishimia ponticola]|uniref:Gfo/Idh/MocA family oxidoreductase n=1 Tax=Aliishimia ponticola TaxID=2499833 RepID=A0A4S4N9J7_9RHOB|nr:Gfo/Idh/MocA family oxidoreductase [Aliishimia ponticola]THH35924.1 Gfo/Idh/MocA family oxidoreductase [Aliishimia ponticola]